MHSVEGVAVVSEVIGVTDRRDCSGSVSQTLRSLFNIYMSLWLKNYRPRWPEEQNNAKMTCFCKTVIVRWLGKKP